MGAAERAKGARGERHVARTLRDGGLDAERQIQQRRIQDCGDVHVSLTHGRIMVECKDLKTPTWGKLLAAMAQSEGYLQVDGDIAAACMHVPRTSKWLFCMWLDDAPPVLDEIIASVNGDNDGSTGAGAANEFSRGKRAKVEGS